MRVQDSWKGRGSTGAYGREVAQVHTSLTRGYLHLGQPLLQDLAGVSATSTASRVIICRRQEGSSVQ